MTLRNTSPNSLSAGPQARDLQISTVLSWLILLGGLLTIGVAAYMVLASYSPLPFWDEWSELHHFAAERQQPFVSWLWTQHNEHRILTTKLLLMADLYIFRGRQTLLLTSIFSIQLLQLFLLSWSMWVLGGLRAERWRTAVGLVAFCLFCATQWENLVWGFQVCFVLPLLLASAAFAGLVLYWRRRLLQPGGRVTWLFLVLSMLAAEVATLSLSNGLLLWPLLLAAAILLRLGRPAVIVVVVVGTVCIASFFYGYYLPDAQSGPGAALQHAGDRLHYVLVYLGSPWTRSSIGLATLFGVIGLVAALSGVLWAWPRVQETPIMVQLLLTIGFCIGCGMITSIGRAHSGLAQAFGSRYQSIVLLFWCCLGLLVLLLISPPEKGRMPLIALQALFLIIMVRGAEEARFPLRDAIHHGFELRAASMSLVTGVQDAAQLEQVFPSRRWSCRIRNICGKSAFQFLSIGLPSNWGSPWSHSTSQPRQRNVWGQLIPFNSQEKWARTGSESQAGRGIPSTAGRLARLLRHRWLDQRVWRSR